MSRNSLLLCAAVAAMLAPAVVHAQLSDPACPAPAIDIGGARDTTRDTTARVGATTTGSPASDRGPAIVLYASASAREVRFAAQPRIIVRLCGGVMDSVRVLERRNLPDPVQPGVTYRDVYVAVEILGHLNATCIASKLTGMQPGNADPCASLQLRDSTSTRRPPP